MAKVTSHFCPSQKLPKLLNFRLPGGARAPDHMFSSGSTMAALAASSSLLSPLLISNLITTSRISPHIICRGLRTIKKRAQASASLTKTEILDDFEDAESERVNREFFKKINEEIKASEKQRLFAICHLYGKQYLFSEGDQIVLQKYFPIPMGTRIKLEKVMCVGSSEFTLLGRPILDRDLVQVECSLVERTLTHTHSAVHMVPRRGTYRRWHFQRYPLSVLRINRIKICHPLNESQSEIQ